MPVSGTGNLETAGEPVNGPISRSLAAGPGPFPGILVRAGRRCGLLLCLFAVGSAAGQAPKVDPDTLAFATYVSDVSRLNGMYRGVADYCKQYVPALIIVQSDAAWRDSNGRYIDSIDLAIERYAAAKAEPERRDEVIQQLKANAQAWFQAAHTKSNVLAQVQTAGDKSATCSEMLGTMASGSFQLKRMSPADDDYWSNNLQP